MGPGARIGDGGYTKLKQVKLLSTRGTQGSVLGIQFARKNAHIAPRAMWSLASLLRAFQRDVPDSQSTCGRNTFFAIAGHCFFINKLECVARCEQRSLEGTKR
jgi:hypothetical protein